MGPAWPFPIVWAREHGWINAQDPGDGTWHAIRAKDAPTGWPRIASEAKRQPISHIQPLKGEK